MNEANAPKSPQHGDLASRARVAMHEPLDRQLAPLGQRAMAALAPRRGERILDIGCGAGQTVLQLAEAVGADGAVLGVDISPIVLELAQRRAGGRRPIAFVEGDAEVFPFEHEAFDAAFSRFGTMFFTDPVAAFANIHRALKRGGRLAFVCWRNLAENDLDNVPLQAAYPFLKPPPRLTPDVPGPFSFADPARVRRILAEAGFEDIAIAAYDEKVGSGDLETMVAVSLCVGFLGKIMREAPELRDAVVEPVRRALAAYEGPEGVTLNAATWIVTARAAR